MELAAVDPTGRSGAVVYLPIAFTVRCVARKIGVDEARPLSAVYFSGKYRRGDTANTDRLSGTNPFGDSNFADRNWDVLDVVNEITAEVGRSPAQVALAWAMARPGVSSILIGARTFEQLNGNLAAASLKLDDSQTERLNEVSAPAPTFSAGLTSPAVRRMIFGGQNVHGWGE